MGIGLPRIMMPGSRMESVLQLRPSPTAPRCYSRLPRSSSSDSSTDLDASLRELGMLSSVVDARRDYLVEKLRRGLTSPPGLCILSMNPACLTDLSTGGPATDRPANATVPLLTLRRSKLRRHRSLQPYDYPWRPRLVDRAWALLNSTVPEEEVQDDGKKSSLGSPAKPQGGGSGEEPSHAGPIFRSRSLNDLAACAVQTRGDSPRVVPRLDIDTVSRRIGNLRVT